MAVTQGSTGDQALNPIQFKHHTGASTIPAIMPGALGTSSGASNSSGMPPTAASTWMTVESYKNAASQANEV